MKKLLIVLSVLLGLLIGFMVSAAASYPSGTEYPTKEIIFNAYENRDWKTITGLLEHPIAGIRERTYLALIDIKDKLIDLYLIRSLEGKSPELIDKAIRGLMKRKTKEAVESLKLFINDKTAKVEEDLEGFSITDYLRGVAARALGEIAGQEDLKEIKEMIKCEVDQDVKYLLEKAYNKISGDE